MLSSISTNNSYLYMMIIMKAYYDTCVYGYGIECHFQQYFSYIKVAQWIR